MAHESLPDFMTLILPYYINNSIITTNDKIDLFSYYTKKNSRYSLRIFNRYSRLHNKYIQTIKSTVDLLGMNALNLNNLFFRLQTIYDINQSYPDYLAKNLLKGTKLGFLLYVDDISEKIEIAGSPKFYTLKDINWFEENFKTEDAKYNFILDKFKQGVIIKLPLSLRNSQVFSKYESYVLLRNAKNTNKYISSIYNVIFDPLYLTYSIHRNISQFSTKPLFISALMSMLDLVRFDIDEPPELNLASSQFISIKVTGRPKGGHRFVVNGWVDKANFKFITIQPFRIHHLVLYMSTPTNSNFIDYDFREEAENVLSIEPGPNSRLVYQSLMGSLLFKFCDGLVTNQLNFLIGNKGTGKTTLFNKLSEMFQNLKTIDSDEYGMFITFLLRKFDLHFDELVAKEIQINELSALYNEYVSTDVDCRSFFELTMSECIDSVGKDERRISSSTENYNRILFDIFGKYYSACLSDNYIGYRAYIEICQRRWIRDDNYSNVLIGLHCSIERTYPATEYNYLVFRSIYNPKKFLVTRDDPLVELKLYDFYDTNHADANSFTMMDILYGCTRA
ncbi:NTP-binding protein [Diaphorina citri reovirus]|nr:NTP-binding protein [Diaphorina citri reovirus]